MIKVAYAPSIIVFYCRHVVAIHIGFRLDLEGAPRSTLLSTLSSGVLSVSVFCNLWLACLERFLPCYCYICQSCTLGSWKLEAC
ncbi:hypothetical protein JB92DRAFT_3006398 [Gautieria morchelliformis]|nr:hypothetical protein JB92DRAFT_3006398 [Gautieria morchelliformis]